MKHDIRWIDEGRTRDLARFVLRHIGAGRPAIERAKLAATFMSEGRRIVDEIAENHWRTVDALMERLQLSDTVRASVAQTFERWDGRGDPDGIKGEDLLIPTRLVNVADVVEVFRHAGGIDAAIEVARARRGTRFDPKVVDAFCEAADDIFAELETVTSWDALMAAEPSLDRELTDDELDRAMEAIAEFVDLKSPYTLGHSRGVADLAGDAAIGLGLPAADVRALRRAALLHDLGRLGVSNAVWDKRAPLTAAEMERVRLHPRAGGARRAARRAHRWVGLPAGRCRRRNPIAGRILAAADVYRAKLEPRPHRPAGAAEDAAAFAREEVRAGRLDGAAVDAVLRAAGHRVRRRRLWPAGLTAREVEILRLVAQGLSHKEIAERLVISRKTASNHVERIYAKTGVSNRTMAALFAVKHGLISTNDLLAGTDPT